MKYLLSFLLLVATACAQTDSTSADSTEQTPSGIRAGRGGFSISSGKIAFGLSHPSISLGYGMALPALKGITTTLASPRMLEIHSGGMHYDTIGGTTTITEATRDGLFFSIFSPQYGASPDSLQPQIEGWRLGLFLGSGYAYAESPTEPTLTLLHNSGLVWTSLSIKKLPTDSPDSVALLPFADNFRFGNLTGFTLRYNITDAITVDASYERTLMYNDFSFFRWAGSTLVDGIAQGILKGMVISKIEEKSPKSVPVANLILRSALSFALYELRRNNQHFPFGGNNPLSFDAVRIGMSFNF